jgi:hypothetical protein
MLRKYLLISLTTDLTDIRDGWKWEGYDESEQAEAIKPDSNQRL